MENISDFMPLSNDWNKERLATLKHLFPDLFTNEGKLNTDELKKVVDPNSVSETERYEFRWFGKSQAKRNAFTPSNATLIFDDARSVNPSVSENLIIEGENLETLKLLSNSYRGQVKCIYIDPPYNKDKDYLYTDIWKQDTKGYWEDAGITENGVIIDTATDSDGKYHSNWMNMLYTRLLIARQLLSEDGVIFISIDDVEVHHLRKLCDEVFGPENFVAEFVWQKRKGGGNDSSYVAIDHEYILCITKDKNSHEKKWRIPYEEEYLKRYKEEDSISKYYWDTMAREGLQSPIIFDIECPDGTIIEKGKWQMAEKTFLVKKDKGDIKFIQNKDNGWTVMHKVRKPDGKAFRSIINSITNSDAAKEMVEIFGADLFDNPKPSALISKLIYLSTTESDIILDFFAGSGSTAHSVMNINLEHQESNRKFILVQIPQVINDSTETGKEAIRAGFKKISDITIERNKRVIEKIITKKKTQKPDLFTNETKEDALKGLGFKVFKLVKSNFPRVEYAPDPEKTDEENIELLKKYISEKEAQLVSSFNRDELMTEILLKKGFNLNYTVALHLELKGQREGKIGTYVQRIDIVRDGEKEALICMDEFLLNETIEYFKKHINRKFICLERALDTTKKYNLKHYMGDNFIAF
ncbi:MAG: hypothetical protein CVT94_10920 [Bacteroidetes bacterium HGW-Bacteroidetes-11]|nr:MAG: hypothetical protein CVT94_10920 [Bacteroidetes bacterium HGW-Bacteroidetes-11]